MNGPRWPHPDLKTEPRERRKKKSRSFFFFIFTVLGVLYTTICVSERERERERDIIFSTNSRRIHEPARAANRKSVKGKETSPFPISNQALK